MILKEQSRLDVRKYSFSQRTIKEWITADCIQDVQVPDQGRYITLGMDAL